MGTFVMIAAYILIFIEIIWYFTCTKHEDIPLALVLLDIFLSCIPGFNCVMVIINVVVLGILSSEGDIELKDNWINRKFLAHRE